MEKENISAPEMNSILNKKSGLAAISKMVPDFREIELASNENEEAKIAIDIFTSTIAQYVARYAVKLGGLDLIIFTGGIGENQITIRKSICEQLSFMGVEIDSDKNNIKGEERQLAKSSSNVDIWLVPTNEELMIAKETMALI